MHCGPLHDNLHVGTLLFSAEPVFVSDSDRPMNDNFTEGNTAEFKCHADADPTADVTWYINGEEITGMSLLLTNAESIFYNHCQLYSLLHMYSVVSVPMLDDSLMFSAIYVPMRIIFQPFLYHVYYFYITRLLDQIIFNKES